jgi:hypothetical protein
MRSLLVTAILAIAVAACATLQPADAPSDADEFHVVFISDLNSSYGSTEYEPEVHEVVRLIADSWRPDLVLVAGDLIAGQRAALPDENVREMWDAFDLAIYNPIRAAGVPFVFTVGNHDASGYPAHERDRRFALDHWAGRDLGVEIIDSLDFPLNYSFRAGPVFVVVWDASTEFGPHEEHVVEWTERQFARPEAVEAAERWVIGHVPPFGVAEGRNRPGEVLRDPDVIMERFHRWNVTMHIGGHHHAFYPGHKDGIDMLHLGALGQGTRPLIGSDREPVQTVTILRLQGDRRDFTTYEVRGSTLERLNPAALPASIESINGVLHRME